MQNSIRALILGDIVGKPGYRALFIGLKNIIKKRSVDIVIANGENAADGYGLTPDIARSIFQSGVNIITSGNHIWQKQEIFPFLDSEELLLRPENYPPGVPGHGYCFFDTGRVKIAVLNLEGRLQMSNIQCPFRRADSVIPKLKNSTKIIIVDFHAEVPEEKEALARYLDGRVSVLVGTHTHVQTADERILPRGTAYITDIGMTGPSDSVIGMRVEDAIRRSVTQMPIRMEVAEKPADIMGVVVEIDISSGKALSIERIKERSVV